MTNAVTINSRLENLRVVLVEPSHPGNVGAAARAMKTMGLADLALVQPQRYPSAEATAMASGADDLLQRAALHPSLDAAIADCHLVLGASARPRSLPWPTADAREAAREALEATATGRVALVFGRERTGLDNSELERCHLLVNIPANAEYSSLNLAMAVQVIAYEMRLAAGATVAARGDAAAPAAAADMQNFYTHLEQVLRLTQFLDPANPRHLLRRLKRLFNRARLDANEVNIMRGLLSSVEALQSDSHTPAAGPAQANRDDLG